jgi:hypothetical protein
MIRFAEFVLIAALAATATSLHAANLEPLHGTCSISAGEQPGKFRLHNDNGECGDGKHHCGSNFGEESFSRWSGFSAADLAREGAQLTASFTAEAGTFACAGTVHDGSLAGDSTFTPDSAFAARMAQMGFTGLESEKLQTYAFVDVQSAWASSLQQAGMRDLTTDNLIALRIFKVDPAYIHSITELGYGLPSADQFVALRVQGVNAAEVREIRALGFQPTLDELVEIRIFHITPDFIRRMQARNLGNLTIAKLVQIRIFKLAD